MFQIMSPAFAPDGPIPSKFTCDGPECSPPLAWGAAPSGSRSLALLVDDPDAPDPAAPTRVWVHWIRYNLPPTLASLPEGAGNRTPDLNARECLNDANRHGYPGPCPPIGRHRYYFRIFALDTVLPDLGPKARRGDFERVMSGHMLAATVVMGTYAHPGNG